MKYFKYPDTVVDILDTEEEEFLTPAQRVQIADMRASKMNLFSFRRFCKVVLNDDRLRFGKDRGGIASPLTIVEIVALEEALIGVDGEAKKSGDTLCITDRHHAALSEIFADCSFISPIGAAKRLFPFVRVILNAVIAEKDLVPAPIPAPVETP
jgi:hypothetical protein